MQADRTTFKKLYWTSFGIALGGGIVGTFLAQMAEEGSLVASDYSDISYLIAFIGIVLHTLTYAAFARARRYGWQMTLGSALAGFVFFPFLSLVYYGGFVKGSFDENGAIITKTEKRTTQESRQSSERIWQVMSAILGVMLILFLILWIDSGERINDLNQEISVVRTENLRLLSELDNVRSAGQYFLGRSQELEQQQEDLRRLATIAGKGLDDFDALSQTIFSDADFVVEWLSDYGQFDVPSGAYAQAGAHYARWKTQQEQHQREYARIKLEIENSINELLEIGGYEGVQQQ